MSDVPRNRTVTWLQQAQAYLTPARLGWLSIGIGVLARLYVYARNRSLWFDEAALVEGLLAKQWHAPLTPLLHDQAAPFGFVIAEMAIIETLGPSEYALRLVPMLCALLTLPLVYILATKVVSAYAAAFATAVVALSARLIFYSANVKPYAGDALFACIILLLAARYFREPRSAPSAVWLAITGAVALWFSYPAIFILAGVAVAMVADLARGADRRRIVGGLAIWLLWGASFVPHYVLWISGQAESDYMQDFWADAFLPLELSAAPLKWLILRPFKVLALPMGFSYPGVAYALLVIGLIVFIRHRDRVRLAILASLALVFVASALHLYPAYGRLLIFAAPSIALMLGAGAGRLMNADTTRGRWPSRLVVVVALLPLAWSAAHYLKSPWQSEMRPVAQYMQARMQPGDTVYATYASRPGLKYYLGVGELEPPQFIIGAAHRADAAAYLDELERLPDGRVWLVFGHVLHTEVGSQVRSLLLALLDGRGARLDGFEAHGACVYLYDLRAPSATDAPR